MPSQTPNYGLPTGVETDDFVQPEHQNRVADTLDRVVGMVLKRLFTQGVHVGWALQTDKTVGPGEGLVGGCWCTTVEAQAITGLQNGAVNHVFAQTNQDSAPSGSVDFYAQLAAEGPSGSVYLGWMELDESGNVVDLEDEEVETDRQCFGLWFARVAGEGTVSAVPAGAEVEVAIDHSQTCRFRIPGAIHFDVTDEAFSWRITDAYRDDGFTVVVTNEGSDPADLEYSWQREGIRQ